MDITAKLRRTEECADNFNLETDGILFTNFEGRFLPVTYLMMHAILGASEFCGEAADEIDKLREENKRLREALEKIESNIKCFKTTGDYGNSVTICNNQKLKQCSLNAIIEVLK